MPIEIIAMNKDKCVELRIDHGIETKPNYHSTRHFMEGLCLSNGTTLEGCYAASRILLDNAYKRPIYIGGSCRQIFVPTSSLKNSQCTWISLEFLLNDTLDHFNTFGYEILSEKSWQKHLSDGIALKREIFKKETF